VPLTFSMRCILCTNTTTLIRLFLNYFLFYIDDYLGLGNFPAICWTPSTIGCSPCPKSPTLFIKSAGIRFFAEFTRPSIRGAVVGIGVVVVVALVVVVVALVVALVVVRGGVVTATILRVDIAMVGFVVALVVVTTADFTVGFVVTTDLVVTAPDFTVTTALVLATDFRVVTCLDFLDSDISALPSTTARPLTDD